jgi:hypothetical protein
VRLSAEYVAEHVELGYACIEMVAQGRTIDDAFIYLDRRTTARGLYVSMTCGAHTNEVYVVTIDGELVRDVVEESMHRVWVDEPVLTHAQIEASQQYHRLEGRYPDLPNRQRVPTQGIVFGIGL